MKYKHQDLIDELNLTECPSPELSHMKGKAFRWVHSPITHDWNFLPNIKYNRVRNKPTRCLRKEELCGQCNLSFFISEDSAREKYSLFKRNLEQKHQELLDFYTHIAEGMIEENDGHATKIKKGHFGFYEFEGCQFDMKFNISSLSL